MKDHPSVFIVLPCHNEEENIKDLVKWISTACSYLDYTIIAVDDGSRDETGKVLKRLQSNFPIVLLRHRRRLGLPETLQTGLAKAAEMAKSDDAIVVMDADLTHDPTHISSMLSTLRKGYGVVIASRYTKGGKQFGVPFHRIFLSRSVCYFLRLFVRFPIKDATSGYRCYKASILRSIMQKYGKNFIDSSGFEISVELLVKAYKIGAKVTEISMILDYSKKKGESKIKIAKTIRDYVRLIKNLSRW